MAHTTTKKIAFALGGMGGSNAHGVGFLEAARTKGVTPHIISCTSGMIYWVYKYLQHQNLEEELRQQTLAYRWFPPSLNWLNWARAVTLGVPGVFRPALMEYWRRWMLPLSPFSADTWFDRMLPVQWLVPTRQKALFEDIARVFKDEKHIGVVFNVFDPRLDIEYLHMNDAAARFMHKHYDEEGSGDVRYEPIDAAAVEHALWLYLYGFDHRDKLDGAYHRQIILRELHDADIIYTVRPQNERWIGDLPSNMLKMRDLEIELWFNASYDGDVAGIELTNGLIEKQLLKPTAGNEFHPVQVVPVEIGVNRGFFNYFVEDMDTYFDAFTKALEAFDQLRDVTGRRVPRVHAGANRSSERSAAPPSVGQAQPNLTAPASATVGGNGHGGS